MSNLAEKPPLWYHNSKMSGNKERTAADWLDMFKQGKELREQVKKGEAYASSEIKDIQKRASKAKS